MKVSRMRNEFLQTKTAGPRGPAVRLGQGSVTGFAFSLVRLAAPWSSGTGGTTLRGLVWVRSGRFMPCFAMGVSVVAPGQIFRVVLETVKGIDPVGTG